MNEGNRQPQTRFKSQINSLWRTVATFLLVCKIGGPCSLADSMTEANLTRLSESNRPLPFWPANAPSETLKAGRKIVTDN
jgi:hypothetical protein